MNIVKIFFIVAFCATISSAFAQDRFNNCTAAFLNDQLVVNEYTPEGYCEILKSASGELTVQTADLSPEKSTPTGKVPFMVAIRDSHSKTLMAFSDDTYKKLDVKKVLAKCRPGDAIVLLTMDDQHFLPHNEILVK